MGTVHPFPSPSHLPRMTGEHPGAELAAIDGAIAELEESLVVARVRALAVDPKTHPYAALAALHDHDELQTRWHSLMGRRSRALGLPAVRIARAARDGVDT